MGREKKTQPGPRGTAKDRHKKASKVGKPIDRSAPLPPGLVAAKPVNAITNNKHQSYFEFIENKERKKPLLLENTTNANPPPGMRYIPIGNPELTERCQDISRELGASVYIVTKAKKDASDLSLQIHRVGYHVRENIVDRALVELGLEDVYIPELIGQGDGLVEKIPENQDDIDKQADAALRELFPRIPNTDRQQIIDHAFQKGRHFKGDPVVGLQQDLALSRRVQLAVLAHIRHNHTRYDELLRETTWHNARRATEQLCLDILVKWRGDDENGRNQLDEILREVVVLSDDSDDEDSDEEPDSESSEILIDKSHNACRVSVPAAPQNAANRRKRLSTAVLSRPGSPMPHATPGTSRRLAKRARKRAKHRERNFSRYEAARDAAWDNAKQRQRAPDGHSNQPVMADSSASHGAYLQNRPVVPVENRAPVNDVGHPHPQMRSLPGQPGDSFYENRQRTDGPYTARPQPMRSQYLPSGYTIQKVNDTSNTLNRGPMNHGNARAPESHQLQDFLHPSIEPKSPGSVRPPPRYTRGMVEYTDRRGDEPQYHLNSPPRAPVVRDESHLHRPQIHQSYPVHTRALRGDQDLVRAPEMLYHSMPQDAARPATYQPAREYGSVRPRGHVDRTLHQEDQYGRYDSVLGEKANPIMIEDQNVHPGTVYLRTGESVRDRFGPGVEILAVRRPQRDDGPDPHRPMPVDEGFIRLRENRPTEQRNGLEEEGFLRLRERPIARPVHPAYSNNTRPSFDDLRAHDLSQVRPVDASGQAVYVRRAERPPPTDLSYHGLGPERVERLGHERVVQRDLPSPVYGGARPIEHDQYHPSQGTYGIPVHRHARPMQRAGDPFRLGQYPPSSPPAQRHWPRVNDNVIVLE